MIDFFHFIVLFLKDFPLYQWQFVCSKLNNETFYRRRDNMVGLGFAFYFCLKLKYYAFVDLNEKALIEQWNRCDICLPCSTVKASELLARTYELVGWTCIFGVWNSHLPCSLWSSNWFQSNRLFFQWCQRKQTSLGIIRPSLVHSKI